MTAGPSQSQSTTTSSSSTSGTSSMRRAGRSQQPVAWTAGVVMKLLAAAVVQSGVGMLSVGTQHHPGQSQRAGARGAEAHTVSTGATMTMTTMLTSQSMTAGVQQRSHALLPTMVAGMTLLLALVVAHAAATCSASAVGAAPTAHRPGLAAPGLGMRAGQLLAAMTHAKARSRMRRAGTGFRAAPSLVRMHTTTSSSSSSGMVSRKLAGVAGWVVTRMSGTKAWSSRGGPAGSVLHLPPPRPAERAAGRQMQTGT